MTIKFEFSVSDEEEVREGYVDYLKEKILREATKFINEISPFKRQEQKVYGKEIVKYTSEVVVFNKEKFEQEVRKLQSFDFIHQHQVTDILRKAGW